MGGRREQIDKEFQEFREEGKEDDAGRSGPPGWLMTAVLILILLSGYQLFRSFHSHYEGQEVYRTLEEEVVSEKIEAAEKKAESGAADIRVKRNGVRENRAPIQVDFATLSQTNKDIVAWVYVEALEISYPVLQSTDNDYYLHRTVEGTYNFAGSVFMDCENNPDFEDRNTILYGHNMANGSMFGRLKEFNLNQAYETSPYVWILTEQGDYRYEIFSAQVVTVSSECYTLFGKSDDLFPEFLQRMKLNSDIETRIQNFKDTDKVLTLSTCAGGGNDASRYVVQAVR